MRRIICLVSVLTMGLSACGPQDDGPDATANHDDNHQTNNAANQDPGMDPVTMRAELRAKLDRLEELGIFTELEMPPEQPEAKVKLGQALFFDAEMSGNRDAACATCHRPTMAGVDGLSLPVGTTARVDPETGARTPGEELSFVARNAPDLFNRGHEQVTTMFWDKRLDTREVDGEMRFVLYDKSEGAAPQNYLRVMPRELDNILAAQNMLPPLNRDELRGANGSLDVFGNVNELAQVPDVDFESAWKAVMKRLLAIEGYRELFAEAYPDIPLEEMTFVQSANAISAFIVKSFTFLDSPWDRFVAGEDDALTDQQVRGALVFFSDKAKCSACHAGPLFTDQLPHNIGVPPIGSGPDPTEYLDRGVTHRSLAGPAAAFAFRTPPLRNVELTAPYMHNGAYATLEGVIRHKNHTKLALWNYDITQLRPEFQVQVHRRPESFEAVEATLSPLLQEPLELTDQEVEDLVAFLKSLTSPSARDLSHIVPESVPSGLLVEIPEQPVPHFEQ